MDTMQTAEEIAAELLISFVEEVESGDVDDVDTWIHDSVAWHEAVIYTARAEHVVSEAGGVSSLSSEYVSEFGDASLGAVVREGNLAEVLAFHAIQAAFGKVCPDPEEIRDAGADLRDAREAYRVALAELAYTRENAQAWDIDATLASTPEDDRGVEAVEERITAWVEAFGTANEAHAELNEAQERFDDACP